MSEGAPFPGPHMQNGHQGDPPKHLTLSGAEEAPGPRIGPADSRASIFGRDEGVENPEEPARRADPGRPRRGVSAPNAAGESEIESIRGRTSSLSVQARDAEELLSRARSHADSLGAQAQAEAEELLSRAQAQADLLRGHAEAMRAEAEYMRAEADALRAAVRDEAEANSSSAREVAARSHAAAEELRSAMQLEADAARQEFERMRAEAMSIRRLLRAEIDAGLADTERMRGEVQRLCAETNKLAAELGLLFARTGAAGAVEDVGGEGGGRPVEETPPRGPTGLTADPVSWALDVARPSVGFDHREHDRPRPAAAGTPDNGVAAAPRPPDGVEGQGAPPFAEPSSVPRSESGQATEATHAEPDKHLLELLRQIWDAASGDPARLAARPSSDASSWPAGEDAAGGRGPGRSEAPGQEAEEPIGTQGSDEAAAEEEQGDEGGRGLRASQPLIGSGGWQAKQVAAADRDPEAAESTTFEAPQGRRRRRFHRG